MRRPGVGALAAVAAAGLLLAACTPVVPRSERMHDRPAAVPQDLTWQFATSCMLQLTSGGTVIGLRFAEGDADIQFEEDTPATVLDQQVFTNCFAQYRFEPRADGYNYVDAFERAQLWEYYTSVTEPCMAERGVTVPTPERSQFFAPDRRPWNPYTSMDDLPFDQLLALYEACPPIPDYLADRHEP